MATDFSVDIGVGEIITIMVITINYPTRTMELMGLLGASANTSVQRKESSDRLSIVFVLHHKGLACFKNGKFLAFFKLASMVVNLSPFKLAYVVVVVVNLASFKLEFIFLRKTSSGGKCLFIVASMVVNLASFKLSNRSVVVANLAFFKLANVVVVIPSFKLAMRGRGNNL